MEKNTYKDFFWTADNKLIFNKNNALKIKYISYFPEILNKLISKSVKTTKI